MKLDINKELHGLFILKGKSYSGIIVFSPNNSVKIVITTTTNNCIFEKNFRGMKISRIIGSIKEENVKITIIDGFVFESLWSSNGILEYTIFSNMVIFGENIKKRIINIHNLHLMVPLLNKYIGNRLEKARFNISEKIVDFSIKYENIINEFTLPKYELKVILKSFFNIDKYDLRNKFEVEQFSPIILEFEKPKEIYESMKYVFTIEAFFSFIFQRDCFINEIVYFKEGKTNLFNHIYIKHQEGKNIEKINSMLFDKNYLINNISKLIANWIHITNEIKYLRYFMLYFFENKYIDQRIVAQVNLIEALHRHYFGDKKDDKEIEIRNKRIISQIKDEEDKIFISNILKEKSNYGIRRKINDISLKSNLKKLTKKEIDSIVKIRSILSHGSVYENIDIEQFDDLSKKLNKIINNIIKQELEK